MKSVLETCKPRPEILAGMFNPEVFTASLGPIIDYYRSGKGIIDSIYTNAEGFFREATYPTQGLRLTLAEVFGRDCRRHDCSGHPQAGDGFWRR